MSTLAELQHRLQAHVLEGDPQALADVLGDARSTREQRLHVYASAYRTRLIEALGSNYPRLAELLGETAFAALSLAYIEAHRSTHRSIRWYGAELASLLAEREASRPWLAELARWEWAIAAAFDAADAPPVEIASLASVPPGAWAELRLTLHPSAQLLDCCTNAPIVFKALTDEAEAPTPTRLERPQSWLIWRAGLEPSYRSLTDAEAQCLKLALAGECFATLCESLAHWAPAEDVPLQAAMLLKSWLNDGLICHIHSVG